MIKVNFTKKGSRYILTADGHSGYNPGNDIVCSAATMLAFILANELAITDERAETETLEATLDVGHIRIEFIARLPIVARIMSQMVAGGYKAISEEYPENLEFTFGGIEI